MKTLKDVKVGENATVTKLHGEGPVKAALCGYEDYERRRNPCA